MDAERFGPFAQARFACDNQQPSPTTDDQPIPLELLIVFSRRDARTIALLLVLLAVGFLFCFGAQGGFRSGFVELDSAETLDYRPLIELNECDWPELCLLPGIDEILARRIVAYRAAKGRFSMVAELERVHGIGPRSVRRLSPWIAIDGQAVADGDMNDARRFNAVERDRDSNSAERPVIRSLE